MIDKKTEKVNSRSTLDQKDFILKFTKKQYFLTEEKDMCYFTSEKNSEYMHKNLKKNKMKQATLASF